MWEIYQDLDEEVRTHLEVGGVATLPNINLSSERASVVDDRVVLGFDSIRGMQDDLIGELISERSNGAYQDFADLLLRVTDLHRKTDAVMNLIRSGCLDGFGLSRSYLLRLISDMSLLGELDAYWNRRKQTAVHFESKHLDIEERDGVKAPNLSRYFDASLENDESDTQEGLNAMERESLDCSPVQLQLYPYKKALTLMNADKACLHAVRQTLEQGKAKQHVDMWGRIRSVELNEVRKAKGGESMRMHAVLEDLTGVAELRFTTKKSAFVRSNIDAGVLVHVKGNAKGKKNWAIFANEVKVLPPPRELIKKLSVKLACREITAIKMHHLEAILAACPGLDSVRIETQLKGRDYYAELPLRVDSGNKALRSYLLDVFDEVVLNVAPDDSLFD